MRPAGGRLRLPGAGWPWTGSPTIWPSTGPSWPSGRCAPQLIAGGRSNLTYLLRLGDREVVLRRPPLGHVLATAHDMAREFRVISALGADRGAGARARCCCAPTPTCSARRST